MTPEEIKETRVRILAGVNPTNMTSVHVENLTVALYEIALQLSELNEREREKQHEYNIPGVDGVPPR